jgi:hypothetical protein
MNEDTPLTDEVRKSIFKRFTADIENRPFTRDKEDDGNWKYIHHLSARSAVDRHIGKLRAVERKFNLCKIALEKFALMSNTVAMPDAAMLYSVQQDAKKVLAEIENLQ